MSAFMLASKFSKITLRLLSFAFSAILLVLFTPALSNAAPAPKPTPQEQSGRTQRSAKKMAADQNNIRAPQVLEVGDSLVGLRVSQGTAFEGVTTFGGTYQKIFHPNIGFNAQLHRSAYSTRYGLGPFAGEWEYTAWTAVLAGSFHADVLRVKNLDTYVLAGVGHAFLDSRWKSNFGAPKPGSADSDLSFLVATVNARYFIDSKWSFTGSLGTGLGALGLGIDYLF